MLLINVIPISINDMMVLLSIPVSQEPSPCQPQSWRGLFDSPFLQPLQMPRLCLGSAAQGAVLRSSALRLLLWESCRLRCHSLSCNSPERSWTILRIFVWIMLNIDCFTCVFCMFLYTQIDEKYFVSCHLELTFELNSLTPRAGNYNEPIYIPNWYLERSVLGRCSMYV